MAVPSQSDMVDEEQQRENFIKTILRHSKNEPDNCPDGHSVEVYGVSFPPERLSLAKDP
jgi:hypothetical protein